MRVFFDTSALTKRYVEEEGAEQVRALCTEADALAVSVLVVPELISTLCRLVREGRLSSENYQSLKSAVQADLSDADLCDLSQDTFDQAIRCLEPVSSTGARRPPRRKRPRLPTGPFRLRGSPASRGSRP